MRSKHRSTVWTLAAAGFLWAAAPAIASPGDYDNSGFVGPEDLATFLNCLTGPDVIPGETCGTSDYEADTDIDAIDFMLFQRLAGHTDMGLMDRFGNALQAASLEPYSPRQSCGVVSCHDLDQITNAYHFQQGRTDAAGVIHMQDDFFGDGRYFVRSPGMYGKW